MEDQISVNPVASDMPGNDQTNTPEDESPIASPAEESPASSEGEVAALAILIALVPLLVFTFFGQVGLL